MLLVSQGLQNPEDSPYRVGSTQLHCAQREWQREAWEMEENPEGEIKEMVELYVSSGVSEADAQVKPTRAPRSIHRRCT